MHIAFVLKDKIKHTNIYRIMVSIISKKKNYIVSVLLKYHMIGNLTVINFKQKLLLKTLCIFLQLILINIIVIVYNTYQYINYKWFYAIQL